MFVAMRAFVYTVLFMGLTLAFLPGRVAHWAGVTRPAHFGVAQYSGFALVIVGLALAVWCVATFAMAGRGTPAPFDPPRRLVVSGPYRFVRNPMYEGAGLLLLGMAVLHESLWLGVYALAFLAVVGLFVWTYEEPTLRRMFGAEYEAYCRGVGRWWPGRRRSAGV